MRGTAVLLALLVAALLGIDGCAARFVPVYDREVQNLESLSAEESAQLQNCPCHRWHAHSDKDEDVAAAAALCLPVVLGGRDTAAIERKEVFAFSVATDSRWKSYDWDQLTTVAWNEDKELLCHAHSKGVKVVVKHNFEAVEHLCDPAARRDWVQAGYRKVVANYADGVNIDTEKPMHGDTSHCLALLVQELRQELQDHTLTEQAQITFDVPWAPRGVDGRYYPWRDLAAAVDFLFVMSYDMRSQIYDVCVAGANAPWALVKQGLQEFLLGYDIAPEKLVLGVPWYGYKYPCVRSDTVDPSVCPMRQVPFFDAPCSDAAGGQMDYADIRRLMRSRKLQEHWDAISESPFLWLQPTDDSPRSQIWFDNPRSLQKKYGLVHELGLRGVGMWNADILDYAGQRGSEAYNDTELMWKTLHAAFPP